MSNHAYLISSLIDGTNKMIESDKFQELLYKGGSN